MFSRITVELTRSQKEALLKTWLFKEDRPYQRKATLIRLPNGSIAELSSLPPLIEKGRGIRNSPNGRRSRLNYVRCQLAMSSSISLEEHDFEKHNPKPVRMDADFGLSGKIGTAHEILLILQEIGVKNVTPYFAGSRKAKKEIYRRYFGVVFSKNQILVEPEISIERLLCLCRELYDQMEQYNSVASMLDSINDPLCSHLYSMVVFQNMYI